MVPCGRRYATSVTRLQQLTPCELVAVPDVDGAAIWLLSSTGCITVRSALKVLCPARNNVPCHKLVWDKGSIPKFCAQVLFYLVAAMCKEIVYERQNEKIGMFEWLF